MPRHTIYLSEEQENFVESMKEKLGSTSGVIRASLEAFQEEQLREYYKQKTEQYSQLHKAQDKVLRKL